MKVEYIKKDNKLIVKINVEQPTLDTLYDKINNDFIMFGKNSFYDFLRFDLGIIHKVKLYKVDNAITLEINTLEKYFEKLEKEIDLRFETFYL